MISVIIPVYKVEPYLRQCVDSIINQTYRDIEILLIDDGSPDQCGDICDEYKTQNDRIRVFHTKNRGLSAARNLGLQEAKGEYIGFVDSDDWIELDMYETLLKYLEETESDIVVSNFTRENARKRYGLTILPSSLYSSQHDSMQALIEWKIDSHVWNKLYRKTVFDGFNFPIGRNYEDIASMHRIIENANKVYVITEKKYHHRYRNNSITQKHTIDNLIDFADSYLSRYYYFRESKPDLFVANQELLLQGCTIGISKVWFWLGGCKMDERQANRSKIAELYNFSISNIPLMGFGSWPVHLRIMALFLHSKNRVTFCFLYATVRCLCPLMNGVITA